MGPLTAQQAVMLNKAAEELPTESDITKADDIELQEIAEKASGIFLRLKTSRQIQRIYSNILYTNC